MIKNKTLIAAALFAAVLTPCAWGFGPDAGAQTSTPPKTTAADQTPKTQSPQTQTPATPAAPPIVQVTVSSKGQDVRDVLASMFEQKKASFVIEPNIHFALWLSLNSIDFDEALGIVCHTAKLNAQQNDGIWYITKASDTPAKPSAPAKPPVTAADLGKTVTTRLYKAELSDVMAKLSSETKVSIVVDKNVPAYKLDAVLTKTTLEYALKRITNATHLSYQIVGDHILIYQPEAVVVTGK